MLNEVDFLKLLHLNVENVALSIESPHLDLMQTWFCQSMEKLRHFHSRDLLVNVAWGGDPKYPLKIRLVGDDVHGNSGSFRHFVSTVAQELTSSAMPILVPYLDTGSYKGYFFIRPGRCHVSEEELFKACRMPFGFIHTFLFSPLILYVHNTPAFG